MIRFRPAIAGTISTIDSGPNRPFVDSKELSPINSAAARIDGMISMNTSEMALMKRWNGFCFCWETVWRNSSPVLLPV
ncbi:hypothetical protein SDC9_173736 [bioreactor metagenome]|uniref:Uncharacterized protein n=1 Tax=bioreactor metagenome TaxID=1076179 RepID=A0A645GKC0_9ZZZZ